jgi:hypothetical protein
MDMEYVKDQKEKKQTKLPIKKSKKDEESSLITIEEYLEQNKEKNSIINDINLFGFSWPKKQQLTIHRLSWQKHFVGNISILMKEVCV